MRSLLRASIALAALLVVAACGVTEDKVADGTSSTTSSTSTSTTDSTTTTSEPDDSTTTEGGSGLDENDPELSDLLLTADDFGTGLEADPDADQSFDPELCEGHAYTVLPQKQASADYQTTDGNSFVSEAIAEFGTEDDASFFLSELQDLNQQCLDEGKDDAAPVTFEPIDDLGDEAVRAVPNADATDPFDIIVVRTDERIVLLAQFGEEQFLSNAVVGEAVDRAAP